MLLGIVQLSQMLLTTFLYLGVPLAKNKGYLGRIVACSKSKLFYIVCYRWCYSLFVIHEMKLTSNIIALVFVMLYQEGQQSVPSSMIYITRSCWS